MIGCWRRENYDGREIVDEHEVVWGICANRYDGTGGLPGFAFAVRGEFFVAGYRFPTEPRWWCGDNDLVLSIYECNGLTVLSREATCVHLDGGGRTERPPDWDEQIARDMAWFTATWEPRFLASAFVSGPAFILLTMRAIRVTTDLEIAPGPARMLVRIIRVAMTVNLVMLFSELFTMFYTGGGHVAAAQYLFFGDHGKYGLVPWIWTSLVCNLLGTVLFFMPAALERSWTRIFACVLCLIGIWIEKGMGLIVPGFIPSTLHEVVEYSPSLTEWKVTAGIWAGGLMLLTVFLKVAVAVFTDSEEGGWQGGASGSSPEAVTVRREQAEEVRAAILALSPVYRTVIELRHYQDATYDEIARTLHLPLSDVKSHLFRARRMLSRRLMDHDG